MKYMDVVGLKPFFVCLALFAVAQYIFLNPCPPLRFFLGIGGFTVSWFFTSWLTWRRLRPR